MCEAAFSINRREFLISGATSAGVGGIVLAAAGCDSPRELSGPTGLVTSKSGPPMPAPLNLRIIRQENLSRLSAMGFEVAGSLPIYRRAEHEVLELRPVREIASRLVAVDAAFTWAFYPEELASSESVQEYIRNNSLSSHMNSEEAGIVAMERAEAHEAHGSFVGWKLENMWPLAWILGFDPIPSITGGTIPRDVSSALLNEFLPGLGASINDLLAESEVRPLAEIVALEDLFYCAHNAVRSAQLGRETVPEGFDPVADGGTVHEKRHSLTWTLSPGVAWDDIDLST